MLLYLLDARSRTLCFVAVGVLRDMLTARLHQGFRCGHRWHFCAKNTPSMLGEADDPSLSLSAL